MGDGGSGEVVGGGGIIVVGSGGGVARGGGDITGTGSPRTLIFSLENAVYKDSMSRVT